MTNSTRETGRALDTPATYRITVAEALGEEWSVRTQGMAVSVRRSGAGGSCTELVGELPDDAALMGVLEALYTHGARLLRVEQVEPDGSSLIQPTTAK